MLSDAHRHMLENESGIDRSVVSERGYDTVSADDERLMPWSVDQRGAGLLIPGWTVHGTPVPGQLRRDVPRIKNKDGKSQELKYESPAGGANYLDVHPRTRDRVRNSTESIIIVEGVKKQDAGISKGLLVVGLPGVWSWKGRDTGLLSDFDAIPWRGRKVIVCYDADVASKPEVQHAMRRLTGVLKKFGATVHAVDWR